MRYAGSGIRHTLTNNNPDKYGALFAFSQQQVAHRAADDQRRRQVQVRRRRAGLADGADEQLHGQRAISSVGWPMQVIAGSR